MSSQPTSKSSNVVWHQAEITRQKREQANGHRSAVLWFTGLSGAGKSTLAHAVEERLHEMGAKTFVIDGDNVRHGLCGDLSFSDVDRVENIRRVGEVAKLFVESGTLTLTAFISPFRSDREKVRALLAEGDFIEVYCRTSLEVCESRDVKGLYAKARAGEIPAFTGISSPYEEPEHPEIIADTGSLDLEVCVDQVVAELVSRKIISMSTK
ncbi:adenylylsulfate kinase [Mariprofundus aestuarium]|uniref:Adenylyl-sulfate kinase n=1 Tax=Mariprofundus aestuarium TaxID=1921086 RepID=A0A2K8KXI8_MARES|nr:adenylyl-sulfate kinase [Mariprofundus aestuarium]ATX79647.1 adenylylsulfate kinase [Mariprofundus aestuarium]